MKKQYKTPEIKVVDVNPSDIICTSPTVYFDSDPESSTDIMY